MCASGSGRKVAGSHREEIARLLADAVVVAIVELETTVMVSARHRAVRLTLHPYPYHVGVGGTRTYSRVQRCRGKFRL